MSDSLYPPAQPPQDARCTLSVLLVLLVLAAGLRLLVIVSHWQQLSLDPDAYRQIAENLRRHGVYSRSREGAAVVPTAFRPPLYPMLLATLAWQGRVTAPAVAALHLALGTLSVYLAWLLARQWRLAGWSFLVAILVACDPILLNQSTLVMTETLATLLAIASLLALTRLHDLRSWKARLLAGSLLGLATLCRPTFLIWVALVTAWMVVAWGRPAGWKCAAVLLIGCCLVLAPWVIRNQRVMGCPIVATTHGGYTLLLGNNPSFYRHLRTGKWGSVWDARELLPLLKSSADPRDPSIPHPTPNQRAGQGDVESPEIVADRRLYQLGRHTIRQDPAMFVCASLVRVARFWTPLPHRLSDDESPQRAVARWCVAAWYLAVLLLALGGLWRLGRRSFAQPWVWGLLCVVALTAVHTVYWSNMRMRAPAMPVIYLACAVGCRVLVERRAGRHVKVAAAPHD